VLISPGSTDPRYRWIEQHCSHVGAKQTFGTYAVYFCSTVTP